MAVESVFVLPRMKTLFMLIAALTLLLSSICACYWNLLVETFCLVLSSFYIACRRVRTCEKIDGVWEDRLQQVNDWGVWHEAHWSWAGNGSAVLHRRSSQSKTCTGWTPIISAFSLCELFQVLVRVFGWYRAPLRLCMTTKLLDYWVVEKDQCCFNGLETILD